MNKKISNTKKELIKFAIIGIFSTLYNYIAYVIIYTLFENIFLASCVGYTVGLINSYIFGKKWVFRHNTSSNKRLIISFLIVYATGCFVSSGIIFAINRIYNAHNIAWIIGTGYSIFNNFLGSKFIVFKR